MRTWAWSETLNRCWPNPTLVGGKRVLYNRPLTSCHSKAKISDLPQTNCRNSFRSSWLNDSNVSQNMAMWRSFAATRPRYSVLLCAKQSKRLLTAFAQSSVFRTLRSATSISARPVTKTSSSRHVNTTTNLTLQARAAVELCITRQVVHLQHGRHATREGVKLRLRLVQVVLLHQTS